MKRSMSAQHEQPSEEVLFTSEPAPQQLQAHVVHLHDAQSARRTSTGKEKPVQAGHASAKQPERGDRRKLSETVRTEMITIKDWRLPSRRSSTENDKGLRDENNNLIEPLTSADENNNRQAKSTGERHFRSKPSAVKANASRRSTAAELRAAFLGEPLGEPPGYQPFSSDDELMNNPRHFYSQEYELRNTYHMCYMPPPAAIRLAEPEPDRESPFRTAKADIRVHTIPVQAPEPARPSTQVRSSVHGRSAASSGQPASAASRTAAAASRTPAGSVRAKSPATRVASSRGEAAAVRVPAASSPRASATAPPPTAAAEPSRSRRGRSKSITPELADRVYQWEHDHFVKRLLMDYFRPTATPPVRPLVRRAVTGLVRGWCGAPKSRSDLCYRCLRPVYQNERVPSMFESWHRRCLQCFVCLKHLSPGGHTVVDQVPVCGLPCAVRLQNVAYHYYPGSQEHHS